MAIGQPKISMHATRAWGMRRPTLTCSKNLKALSGWQKIVNVGKRSHVKKIPRLLRSDQTRNKNIRDSFALNDDSSKV